MVQLPFEIHYRYLFTEFAKLFEQHKEARQLPKFQRFIDDWTDVWLVALLSPILPNVRRHFLYLQDVHFETGIVSDFTLQYYLDEDTGQWHDYMQRSIYEDSQNVLNRFGLKIKGLKTALTSSLRSLYLQDNVLAPFSAEPRNEGTETISSILRNTPHPYQHFVVADKILGDISPEQSQLQSLSILFDCHFDSFESDWASQNSNAKNSLSTRNSI